MSQSHTGSLVDWSNSQIAANECPEAIEFGHGHGLSKIKSFSKNSANCKNKLGISLTQIFKHTF